MLHRNKKENDMNEGKWIGVGGKIEDKETPEECIIREVFEETGLTLEKVFYRGLVTFINTKYETEYIFVYTATQFSGTLKECNEGTLAWIRKDEIFDLNLWDGDKYFLEKLLDDEKKPFSIKLSYKEDSLIDVKVI
ncbi:MAG: DNA mismatch repair protein MutT [Treponema sp. CETP13]|nr:MAG: DNA mismatch repair protein MutT [Treponema sp. CETP13]